MTNQHKDSHSLIPQKLVRGLTDNISREIGNHVAHDSGTDDFPGLPTEWWQRSLGAAVRDVLAAGTGFWGSLW